MEKREMIYDGKSKQLFATDDPNYLILTYKDDATAYYGLMHSSIRNKGILNCHISEIIFQRLEQEGIRTHYVKPLDERTLLCRRTKAFPLEFVVRNVIAGSLARRLDIQEGTMPVSPIYEICLKNDLLRDPMINHFHVLALGYADEEELERIRHILGRANEAMKRIFQAVDIDVIDFKLEFGVSLDGEMLIIDEISPDTARFWDTHTREVLDSDRFRRSLGREEYGYYEILNRLQRIYMPEDQYNSR